MKGKLFQNKRYMTKGVAEKIPFELQMTLWAMIEAIEQPDYLQVFQLEIEKGKGTIQHSQEEPEYKKTVQIMLIDEDSIHEKVFVIDDGDYSTMLLAEEY